MLVRFWGTRGSIARPGAGTVRYGGNTSCVEVRSSSGTLVLLDCGTGAFGLGQSLLASGPHPLRGHILIGHTHWDHIQGFPFFTPLFVPGNEWHVYGPRGIGASLRDSLAGQMQYTYFPVTLEDLGATIHYHDLVEGALDVGDIRVTAQYLNHPALTLGYRLEADGTSVVYASDHEGHASPGAALDPACAEGEFARHARLLAGADLIIHDTQYTDGEYAAKRGWGHSTVEYAVDAALSAGARRLALFHHDPTRSDDAVDGLVAGARERVAQANGALEIIAAAEGMVCELVRRTPATGRSAPADDTARQDPGLGRAVDQTLVAVARPEVGRLVDDAVAEDGLRVLAVHDCVAASSIVRASRPALVLVQDALLDCDAVQLCRRLRDEIAAAGADTPIVLLKSTEDPGDLQREADAGITDRVALPCSQQYLRTRIRAWVLREACRWRNARFPADEERRVRSLQRSSMLDTGAEERFDRFTRIAAALFDVPIALISLVDRRRQWFKSRRGLDATETPRDQAFCAHAILGSDVMQVPDALVDERFADNPLVTGGPRVRFYAGAPLRLGDGSAIGTLCVIDHRPRNFDAEQLRLLRDLAKLAEREFALAPGLAAEVPAAV
jgi:phosphoribosyl 1,2-cyclic phosphodiesterase/CheY-like chemotaxis protein